MVTKILLSIGFFLTASAAFAAPDFTQKSDLSILSHAQSGYRFDTLRFPSADGQRTYRIYLGIPQAAAPRQGYAALFALDGNALTETLTPERLHAFQQPPVLVLIGYDTDLRFDVAARAHDYTPPDENGQTFPDAIDAARTNGGAADFLHFINATLRPRIASQVRLDPDRQILWGHSYGGLFVLYTLLHAPQSFSGYVAADPALWHAQGQLYRQYQDVLRRSNVFQQRSLWIEQSGRQRQHNPAKLTPQQASRLAGRQTASSVLPPEAGRTLSAALADRQDIRAHYTVYPELDHGGLLPVSFLRTLETLTHP